MKAVQAVDDIYTGIIQRQGPRRGGARDRHHSMNTDATLDDLREAVTRLEELAPYARRILGGTHPGTTVIELTLRDAQAELRAAEQS